LLADRPALGAITGWLFINQYRDEHREGRVGLTLLSLSDDEPKR